jgi:hypothetical protein
MKLQDLNRSFGKVLGALAVAFVIQTGSAQAQPGQWAADGCLYTAVFSAAPSGALQGSVQMVRQGCAVQSPDGQARYYDLRTGQLYLMENNPSQQGSKVGKIFKSLIASHKQVLQALQAWRADPVPMDPQAMQQGANSVPMIPQAMQQGAYSATMVPQAMQQGANSVPMVPQAMQQGANSVPMIPQGMQQAAYSATMVPQATQQGANPYFEVPYAVVGGAPVGGAPVTNVTCGFNQPNCLRAGGPNAPAGNLGLPSSSPAPSIKPQGKQARTTAIKARTAPSCVAGSVGCQ